MDRLRRLIMAAALMIAVVEIAPPARSQSAQAGKQPVLIEGLAPEEWIAALDDQDPARRKWALLILGRATPDRAGNAFSRLLAAVDRVRVQDRDPDVRVAADKSLWRLTRELEAWRRAGAERDHAIVRSPLHLVDVRGQPVAGATVSTYFQKDGDRSASFDPYESIESKTSDSNGEASLGLEVLRHLDATGVYAIRPEKDRPLVGLSKITRDQLGKPITIVMHPACRVRLRVECPGLREAEEKQHFELDRSRWWRAAYVMLGENNRAPRPLMACSTTGQLEFLLPPGRFKIMAYGDGTNPSFPAVEVEPGHRVRNLEIEVAPGEEARQGIFRGYHHLVREDPGGRPNAAVGGKTVVLRSDKSKPVFQSIRDNMWDLAFSPDGRRLATAHGHNTNSAEVMLWDPQTGQLLATWLSPDEAYSVFRLAFSPDGRTLAGSVGPMDQLPRQWEIVLWDVEGRRTPRTLPGRASRITAMAFSPDGKTLVSGTDDKTVTLWDMATGRETGRLDGRPNAIVSMAFDPGGRTLAVAGGPDIDLWEWPARRLRARLESEEALAIRSVAFAPDGHSLAVAGKGRDHHGRVWLYDLIGQPPSCNARLTLDREGLPLPNPNPDQDDFRDVAYTPDGHRVVAVANSSIAIWDAATGVQQDFIDRDFDLSNDRFDISPDGRWLAVTGSRNLSLIDLSPVGP
jgi:WD40 repeat protein